jgi:plasmid stability protein
MGSITIRNLPDQSKESLRVQAAKSGMSLEAYVRKILEEASGLESDKKINILELAQGYFGSQGGLDLELPKRGSHRGSSCIAS